MQNNFREFEELVFFDLWIPDSGFRIPDSGFRIPDSGFRFPVSGFRIPVLGLPGQVTIQNWVGKSVGREGLLSVLFVAVTNLVGPCGSVAKNYTLYRRILLMLKYRRLVQREIRKQNGAVSTGFAPWRVRPHRVRPRELILNFLFRVRQSPSMD